MVDKVNLYGSSHVIVCSVLEEKIHMNRYLVKLLTSGTKVFFLFLFFLDLVAIISFSPFHTHTRAH